jgi:hypothetical protein
MALGSFLDLGSLHWHNTTLDYIKRSRCLRFVITLMALTSLPAPAQDFDRLLRELNRGRYDRALEELFPAQRLIRDKTAGKVAQLDAGQMAQMREMRNPAAITSTVALLRLQMEREDFESALVSAMMAGLGLAGLWTEVPAYRKLDYAREDLAEAPAGRRAFHERQMGFAAVEAKEYGLAAAMAKDLLAKADSAYARHSALTLKGLAELGGGQVETAEAVLLDSLRGIGDLLLRDLGPDFRLARALVERGRTAAVGEFLKLAEKTVWKQAARAAALRRQIETGEPPDWPPAPKF